MVKTIESEYLERLLVDKPPELSFLLALRSALRSYPHLAMLLLKGWKINDGFLVNHSKMNQIIKADELMHFLHAFIIAEKALFDFPVEIGFVNSTINKIMRPNWGDKLLNLIAIIFSDLAAFSGSISEEVLVTKGYDRIGFGNLVTHKSPHNISSADSALRIHNALNYLTPLKLDVLKTDILTLAGQGNVYDPMKKFQHLSLWHGEQNFYESEWNTLKQSFLSLDSNWQFWIDWYQSKLDGTLHPSLTQTQQEDLYYKIATFPNELWEEGARAVNHRIAELMEEVKEGERNDFEEETDEPYELELPPQNKDALTFKTNEDGQAQLAPASENEQVLSDEGAKARHEEARYSGEELLRLFDPNKSGANAVAPLIEKTQRCLDALGKTPQEVDIDRLIPRGEALRQIANREENRDDFTDVPPLPDGFKEALNNFLAAYNPYIALDPVLEKRDQIRLGPDEKGQLITTVEGQVIIDSLTEANLLEEDTKDILDEVTNTAEGSTDPESRANRYYSESLKNLGRNILAEVDKTFKSIKKTGKVASEVCFDGAVVGAVMIHQDFARKRAQIILKHEKWFVKSFGRTPGMKKIIVGYIHRIKTNPLLTDDDI